MDVRFYIGLLDRYTPRRVLELCCGSGRVTLPLADAAGRVGAEIVGVDTSLEMLEQARAKSAARAGPAV